MYSTVKPLSSTSIEASQTNFPALQHFFKCNESIGSETLTDSIGGVVLTPNSIGAFDGTKLASATINADTALTSGSWATLGTKEILICIMGTWTAAGTYELTVGDAASGTRFRITEGLVVAHDGTTPLADATNVINDGTDSIAYLYIDKDSATEGNMKGLAAAAGVTAETGSGDGTALAASIDAPNSSITMDGFSNIYGIAVFTFNEIPSDLDTALLWMRNEWAAGNKSIYPSWKDLV